MIFIAYLMKGKRKRLVASRALEWVQNKPPQKVPLQYMDYFELMTVEAQRIQEERLPPS